MRSWGREHKQLFSEHSLDALPGREGDWEDSKGWFLCEQVAKGHDTLEQMRSEIFR